MRYNGDYVFEQCPNLVEEYARELRANGADLVIVGSEWGLPQNVQLAKDVNGVDFVLSGHTHERTHEVIEQNDTLVVEAGKSGWLGKIDLHVAGNGQLRYDYDLEPVFADGKKDAVEPNEYVKRIADEKLATYRNPQTVYEVGAATLDTSMDAEVGRADSPLYRRGLYERPFDKLATDALRWYFNENPGGFDKLDEFLDTYGEVHLGGMNGFRYGSILPPGPITVADLYEFFPVTPPVAVGVFSGSSILEEIESNLFRTFASLSYEQEGGWVDAWSTNAEMAFDPIERPGQMLKSFTVDGEELDPDEPYLAAGCWRPGDPLGNEQGTICGISGAHDYVRLPVSLIDVMEAYLSENDLVSYEETGQIEPVGQHADDIQNMPADGPYHFIQPGVDYADDAFIETRYKTGTLENYCTEDTRLGRGGL